MKKLTVFVLVVSVFSGAVFGQGQEFTFRGLPWGASQEQVIAVLGQPDDEFMGRSGTLVYYHTKVAGHDAELHLWGTSPIFRLQQAVYSIRPDEEDVGILEAIFLDLLAKLSVLYGIPNTNKWSSLPYWVVDKTLIELDFNRRNAFNRHGLILSYESPEINKIWRLIDHIYSKLS